MNKLQTALLASTAVAIVSVVSPALATGVPTDTTPTISDFGFSSTTLSFGGSGYANGYFTVTNNSTGWDVIGFGVGTDPGAHTVLGGVTTTRDQWFPSVLETDMFYQANVTYGSGEGATYGNPLAPGQSDSSFFWAEYFPPHPIFADPQYFIDLVNIDTGDNQLVEGSLDTVATQVPEPAAMSAFVTGLLGLAAFAGLRRRKLSPRA